MQIGQLIVGICHAERSTRLAKRVSGEVEASLPSSRLAGVETSRCGRNDRSPVSVAVVLLVSVVVIAFLPVAFAEQLKPETASAFNHYVELSEQRMSEELEAGSFLRVDGLAPHDREQERARLKQGEVITECLQTLDQGRLIPLVGGLIHHWVGTVFLPGVTLAQTLSFLQDYDNQYKFYAPDVQRSKLMQRNGNDFKVLLRLRKRKVITVILNTEYDVKYHLLGADRATSYSYSTRIAELENAGEPGEHEKPVGNDSGFLWRLNSYWRFLQRDGGVYVQLEAISLTRDIPAGLNWLVAPFVTSIPKESLEFTLTHTRDALERIGDH